jgi:hypothetical protein
VNFPDATIWTFGLSYDNFDADPVHEEKINPKIGVQWNITNDLIVRGAYIQYVKPALSNNQTLEPTQVSGFDQVFDDSNGDVSRRWGIGFDHRLSGDLFLGGEASWRDVDSHVITATGDQVVDFDEQTHRAYVNWLPIAELALSAEFVYDRFQTSTSIVTIDGLVPEEVETYSVPLGIRYFHLSGAFVGFSVSYVNQDVKRTPDNDSGLTDGHDDFFYLDTFVGYRLPRRFGIISAGVTNLLDQKFHYQDDSYREFQDQPSIGPYFPDRLFFGRITLNW